MFQRHPLNPLMTPRMVQPSHPELTVIGAFNAGVTTIGTETLLLLRVAERPASVDPTQVYYPVLSERGVEGRSIARANARFDTSDARLIHDHETGETWPTSISHLRLARSGDGVHFTIDEQPWMWPEAPYECYGIEDARITQLDDRYFINYSAVSALGICTALASTTDFRAVKRHGIMFPPANRDVTLFPERINGNYFCYHRPMTSIIGGLNIWIASSPDLQHWGRHQPVLQVHNGGWEAGRVGGGAPPIRTPNGWLSIYHAADPKNRYCLGAFLTSLDDPAQIIGRSSEPILWPEADYETTGFFPNVVFTCGAVLRDGQLTIYYGASDEVVCSAQARLGDILNAITILT